MTEPPEVVTSGGSVILGRKHAGAMEKFTTAPEATGEIAYLWKQKIVQSYEKHGNYPQN